jgi:hypothetical protein
MPLGLAVLLVVLGVTAVIAALGYLIDKSAAATGAARSTGESGDDSGVTSRHE